MISGPALLLGVAGALAPASAQDRGTREARTAPQASSAAPAAETRAELGLKGAGRPASRAVAKPVRRRGPDLRGAVAALVREEVTLLPDPAPPPDPARRRPPAEEDPYAPLGLRSGGVVYYPDVGAAAGYDSNPGRSSGPRRGSAVYRTEGGLRIQSDWPVHELTGELRGAYSAYPDAPDADRPEGAGALRLRLDATRDTRIEAEVRSQVDTQRPGSPELGSGVRGRPLVSSFGASIGVTQSLNRLQLGLRGTVDRTLYEDAELGDGTLLRQSDRNLTQAGLRLRAGYEAQPGLIPFVEALADARTYDDRLDGAGFDRRSTGLGLRAGTTFEITRILTGEAAAGWQARDYEDPRLRSLRGPVGEAALAWSASPLTTVRLRGTAQIAETTLPGSSGALNQAGTLEIRHDLRRNLTLTAAATLSRLDYDGVRLVEDGFAGSLKLDYRLTRWMSARASYTYERLRSTAPGGGFEANVYLVGLRFNP